MKLCLAMSRVGPLAYLLCARSGTRVEHAELQEYTLALWVISSALVIFRLTVQEVLCLVVLAVRMLMDAGTSTFLLARLVPC